MSSVPPTSPSADALTVLRSVSGRLAGAKSFARLPDGKIAVSPYGNEKWFGVTEIAVANLADLHAVLVDLQNAPDCFVIRGAPLPHADRSRTLRRLYGRTSRRTGELEPATFEDVPRRWLHLDIDGLPCPAALDPATEPEQAAAHVRDVVAEFAPEMVDASCSYAFSSSAGIKPGIRLHLWFWLDRPYGSGELRRWADALNARAADDGITRLVDPVVFGAVQPNYTARPRFRGMIDPIPAGRRCGLIRGIADTVTLAIPSTSVRPRRTAVDGSIAAGRGSAWWLAAIGPGGMYREGKAAVAAFVHELGAEEADRQGGRIVATVQRRLRQADPGDRAPATVDRYVAQVPDWLEWVLARQREKEMAASSVAPTYREPDCDLEMGRARLRGGIARFFAASADYRRTDHGAFAALTATG